MLCYQMFTSSSKDIVLGRVELQTSNLENATVVIEDTRKDSAQRRQHLIQQSSEKLFDCHQGLKDLKPMELGTKCHYL